MSADNFLQGIVGKVGEFYEWLADRLNDDAARAEVLIDLGLPPTIAVGQPFPQHQVKGINEYRKTISIETEVSALGALVSLTRVRADTPRMRARVRSCASDRDMKASSSSTSRS